MQQLTKDQLRALAQCADVKALLATLKELGVQCSEEDAKKLFDKMHAPQELSDDDLDSVAGGKEGLSTVVTTDKTIIEGNFSINDQGDKGDK